MSEYQYPPQPPMQAHRGPLVLTLGLFSLVLSATYGIGVIPSVIALVLSARDLKAMQQGRMDLSGRGLTRAGRILALLGATASAVILAAIVIVAKMFPGIVG